MITPHFHWDLGDIPSIDTDKSGPTYDGTDPSNDPAHYVTGIWPTTGKRTVTLTVSWPAAITREDNGDTLTSPPVINVQRRAAVDVRESRSELTGNS